MSLKFSIGLLAPLIIQPLRYYFSTYTKDSSNLFWDADEKLRTMEIDESFNFNKNSLGEKPRVIVTRGGFQVNKTGLTDNLAQANAWSATGGKKDFKNMVFYSGNSLITIEARNKGTCELLSDMVAHFIIWTRPLLCDSQGFKEFGLPLNVSDCAIQGGEDELQTKFQVQISVPWFKEEVWQLRNDAPILKDILTNIKVGA